MLRFKLFLVLRGCRVGGGKKTEKEILSAVRPPLSEAGALPDPRRTARSAVALICVNARADQISILISGFFRSQTTIGEMLVLKFLVIGRSADRPI